jgi:hypothetical protein
MHPRATAFTRRSSFCLGRRCECAPYLLLLGIAAPDTVREWGCALCHLGAPSAFQIGRLGGARSGLGAGLITHPREEEPGRALLHTPMVPRAGLAVFLQRDDAVGGRLLSLLEPATSPLLAPDIQVLRRRCGIAMAIRSAPAPEDRVQGTALPQGSLPQPPSRWHLLDCGCQPLHGFGTRGHPPLRSVRPTDGTLHLNSKAIAPSMRRCDVGLLTSACKGQLVCQTGLQRVAQAGGCRCAAMRPQPPILGIPPQCTLPSVHVPATLRDLTMQATGMRPPGHVQLVPGHVRQPWRTDGPLGCPESSPVQELAWPQAGLEPGGDQGKAAASRSALRQQGEHSSLRDTRACRADIALDAPEELATRIEGAVEQRETRHRAASRPTASGAVQEIAFPEGFPPHLAPPLHHAIFAGGAPQRSLLPRALWAMDTADRGGANTPLAPLLRDFL